MAPGGRFKRKSRNKAYSSLSKSEIKYLSENTHFNHDAIIDWHKVGLSDNDDDLMKEMRLISLGLHGRLS